MLLFQYGIFNWGDELGEHFSLDITRQFIAPKEDEPYQLNFTLIYEPEPFREMGSYSCWSGDYPDIESFALHIKTWFYLPQGQPQWPPPRHVPELPGKCRRLGAPQLRLLS